MLKYLWTRDEVNRIKYEINFYGSHRYHYIEDDRWIKITSNHQYIPFFYDKSGKISASLIVGENRSGKTSILKSLTYLLAYPDDDAKATIAVFAIDGIDKLFTNISGIKCDGCDVMTLSELRNHLLTPQSIYYNPVNFSFSRKIVEGFGDFPESGVNGFVNISLDSLLNAAFNRDSDDLLPIQANVADSLDNFKRIEMSKCAALLMSGLGKKLLAGEFKIRAPEYIDITILNDYLDPKRQIKRNRESGDNMPLWVIMFWKFFEEIEGLWINSGNVGLGYEIFLYQTLAHAVYQVLGKGSSHMDDLIRVSVAENLYVLSNANGHLTGDIDSDIANICKAFVAVDAAIEKVIQEREGGEYEFNLFRARANSLLVAKERLKVLFQSKAIVQRHPNLWSIPVEKFESTYGAIESLNLHGQWYQFDMRDISTGERMIVSLFARLDHAINSAMQNSSQCIYLLLDEPETSLHPNWQRILFNSLLGYLREKNALNGASFQVILTANQPVVLSDFPRNYVAFLKYDPATDTRSTLSDEELDADPFPTYCSNANDILSHSFFLSQGTVGAFAESRVSAIIQMDSSEYRSNEFAKRETNMIDSKLIKRYIQLKNGELQ